MTVETRHNQSNDDLLIYDWKCQKIYSSSTVDHLKPFVSYRIPAPLLICCVYWSQNVLEAGLQWNTDIATLRMISSFQEPMSICSFVCVLTKLLEIKMLTTDGWPLFNLIKCQRVRFICDLLYSYFNSSPTALLGSWFLPDLLCNDLSGQSRWGQQWRHGSDVTIIKGIGPLRCTVFVYPLLYPFF